MKFKLSPSSISLMAECPRCFWLEKHGVWSRPSGIFPSLPSGMDRILKKHFDNFRNKGKLPPELCNQPHCENLALFGSNKEEKELLEIWRNNKKGVSWTDENENILKGAVDNLLVKGKKLIVLDYKTRGYPIKEDTAARSKNQLDIYNFLFRKNGYETEGYSFLLFYVPNRVLETGEVVFDTELVKMQVDIEGAENLWKKALKLLDGECPSEKCEWCQAAQ